MSAGGGCCGSRLVRASAAHATSLSLAVRWRARAWTSWSRTPGCGSGERSGLSRLLFPIRCSRAATRASPDTPPPCLPQPPAGEMAAVPRRERRPQGRRAGGPGGQQVQLHGEGVLPDARELADSGREHGRAGRPQRGGHPAQPPRPLQGVRFRPSAWPTARRPRRSLLWSATQRVC